MQIIPYEYKEYNPKSWILTNNEGKVAWVAKSTTVEKDGQLFTKDGFQWILKKIEWKEPKQENLSERLEKIEERLQKIEELLFSEGDADG